MTDDRLSADRCYRDYMGWYNPLEATPLESAVYELCRTALHANRPITWNQLLNQTSGGEDTLSKQEPPSEPEPGDDEQNNIIDCFAMPTPDEWEAAWVKEEARAAAHSGRRQAQILCSQALLLIRGLKRERDEARAETERLKGMMPPAEQRHIGPGQGDWAVFAERIIKERDEAREKLAAAEARIAELKARRYCPRCSEDLHAVDALLDKDDQ